MNDYKSANAPQIPPDVVMFWWMRCEFAEQREDWQFHADFDYPGADLLQDEAGVAAMYAAPLGEPPTNFDVRCVYDSRPVNAYDFNYSAAITGSTSVHWNATFNVPNGYRAVPRKWQVVFDTALTGPSANSTANLTQSGAAVPNNQNIIIGMGTGDLPIESFFLCEENTTFGITGFNANATAPFTGSVTVYGNLIPVSSVGLPLAVANENKTGYQLTEGN